MYRRQDPEPQNKYAYLKAPPNQGLAFLFSFDRHVPVALLVCRGTSYFVIELKIGHFVTHHFPTPPFSSALVPSSSLRFIDDRPKYDESTETFQPHSAGKTLLQSADPLNPVRSATFTQLGLVQISKH